MPGLRLSAWRRSLARHTGYGIPDERPPRLPLQLYENKVRIPRTNLVVYVRRSRVHRSARKSHCYLGNPDDGRTCRTSLRCRCSRWLYPTDPLVGEVPELSRDLGWNTPPTFTFSCSGDHEVEKRCIYFQIPFRSQKEVSF